MLDDRTIRAFIALQLPHEVKSELGLVTDVLAGQVPPRSVRWVQPDRMHLTLSFLGDTAVSRLPDVASALDRVAAAHGPSTLRLDELGCYPNRRRPRVIWAGLAGELAPLRQLQAAVAAALQPLGWEPEKRPFRAHLTLGRVKDGRKLRDVDWGTALQPLQVPVNALHLVESKLRPGGPIYTVRHTSRLGGEL